MSNLMISDYTFLIFFPSYSVMEVCLPVGQIERTRYILWFDTWQNQSRCCYLALIVIRLNASFIELRMLS